MIQDVLAKVSQEQIIVAVVIVIADADAVTPARMAESRFLGHIGESAVAIVVIEVICRFLAGGKSLVLGAVQQEDIEPAIVVVIEEGDSTTVGLHDVLLRVFVTVNGGSGKAGARRDVSESHRKRPAGKLRGEGQLGHPAPPCPARPRGGGLQIRLPRGRVL